MHIRTYSERREATVEESLNPAWAVEGCAEVREHVEAELAGVVSIFTTSVREMWGISDLRYDTHCHWVRFHRRAGHQLWIDIVSN